SPGGSLMTIGSAAPAQNLSVNLSENQAVVTTVTEGTASEEYWVRCIPDDFPTMQWTTHADGCSRPPGYYLFGTMSLPPGKSGYAIALDWNGVPVWYKYNGEAVYDMESLDSGIVSF